MDFGHALLNSHDYLASDLLRSICAFADKPLVRLRSNFMGESMPQLDKLESPFWEYPPQ